MDREKTTIPIETRSETESMSANVLISDVSKPSTSLDLDSPVNYDVYKKQPIQKIGFRSWKRLLGLSLMAVAILAGFIFVSNNIASKKKSSLNADLSSTNLKVKQQSITLNTLNKQLGSNSAGTHTLTVNGQVNVNNSLVIQPSVKPNNAVSGQIYYDSTINQLAYYNGSKFIDLAGSSPGNITNVSNNTTNVTNNSYGSSGLVGINGLQGSIAMFVSGSSLGSSLISQTGTTVNIDGTNDNVGSNGTNETVTIGSFLGSSSTNIQAGNGNLSLLTGSTVGSSGNITIQSGDSSTTTAGNVSIDTGNSIINGTVVGDKTFEDGVDNMGDSIFGDNSTVVQSSAEAHSGTHSLAIIVGSNFFPEWGIADGVGNPPMIIPVTQGHTYAFSAWVRAGTTSSTITASVTWSNDGYYGGGQISSQTYGTVTDISSGWRHVTGILTAPAGAVVMGFGFYSNDATSVGEVHYFDDITATDLSSSSSSATINLGTTNAQSVNIGNSGQLAATSIYGGGVNIAAGSGIMNLSATTLTASAGGANLTTTTGALDLTAATSSTWKVGNTGSSGGNLTIQSGNAGGINNNGGNLILQAGTPTGTGIGGSIFVGTGSGATFGYTTAGIFGESDFNGIINASKFTTTTGGTVESMSVRIGDYGLDPPPNNQYQLAIYTDNAGVPGSFIASSAIGTLAPTATWNTLPITASLAASTSYWLVYWTNAVDSGGTNAEIGTTGSGTDYNVSDIWQTGTNNGMPTNIPLGGTFNTINTSIYATFTGNAPAVTIDSFGTLTQNGQAVFQDPANVPNAFQIQNSIGTPLFTADTSGLSISIAGSASNFASLILNNAHFSSTQSNPPGISAPVSCGLTPASTITAGSTDSAGSFTVTAGSGAITGPCSVTISFNQPYGTIPKSIIVMPTLSVGASPQGKSAIVTSTGTNSFTVEINPANPSSGELNSFYYFVIE